MVKKLTAALIVIIMLGAFVLQPCKEKFDNTHAEVEKIVVGPGPEDLAIEHSTRMARLLVACDSRRKKETETSSIYVVNLPGGQSMEMLRKGEPEGLVFHPHGVDVQLIGSEWYFYCVNHNDAAKEHSILQYKIQKDHLEFVAKYDSELLVSPNDLCVLDDGSMLISNDSKKRFGIWEMLFNMKHSTIIYFDGKSEWKTSAKKIRFANGIIDYGNKIYIATTRDKGIYSYNLNEGILTDKQKLTDLKGLDNITNDSNGKMIVAAHPKFGAFLKHAKKSENLSPCIVYSVDPETGKDNIIYQNDGSQISTASTGLIHDQYLYIAQVFDGFILKVKLE